MDELFHFKKVQLTVFFTAGVNRLPSSLTEAWKTNVRDGGQGGRFSLPHNDASWNTHRFGKPLYSVFKKQASHHLTSSFQFVFTIVTMVVNWIITTSYWVLDKWADR